MKPEEKDLIEALLVAEATEGLGAEDQARLAALLAEHPDTDRYAFERAAAAVFMVACDMSEALPAGLGSRLMLDARSTLDIE